MKKDILKLGVLVALAAASCTTEDNFQNQQLTEQELIITATREGDEDQTRTYRNDSDGSIWWVLGDAISLFYGSGTNGGSKFTSVNTTDTTKVTNFTGVITAITGGGEIAVDQTYFWGLYPYQEDASCDGTSVTMTLPREQTAVPGTFATNTFPSIGRSQGLIMGFYNICSGMKFSVTKEGIKKVTLKSRNGELITGKAKVSFEDGIPKAEIIDGSNEVVLEAPAGEYFEPGKYYFLVMFPTKFTNGFTVTLETFTEEATVEKTGTINAKRSNFGRIANIDADAEYSAKEGQNNIIVYTSSDGNIVNPNATDVFGANIVSNEYVNGCGIITFDADIKSIGNSAFKECYRLTSIAIPEGVTSIEYDAFHRCTHLNSIVIPESVTYIGRYAFYYCWDLESIVLRAGLKSIGSQAFNTCSKLTSIVIPESVTNVGEFAFANCYNLNSVVLSESMETLGNHLFYNCRSLISIVIPKSVTRIASYTFNNCEALRSVVIPENVAYIGSYSFAGCSSLSSIYCLGNSPKQGGTEMFDDTNNCPIYVPAAAVEAYKTTEYWSNYEERILAIDEQEEFDPYSTPLCFEVIEGGTITIYNRANKNIQYSTDGLTWFRIYTTDAHVINVASGQKVYFRGNNITLGTPSDPSYSTTFECSAKVYVYGNIMSLLSTTNFSTKKDLEGTYTFYQLFNCNNFNTLFSHPNKKLVLPATQLTENCYNGMFQSCKSLTQAPELPATVLANRCYQSMFYGCSSLTQAPELPAKELADYCYMDMFSHCMGLTQSPILPATTLKHGCYYGMFYGCTGLIIAPDLPATILDQECYYAMFLECANLEQGPSVLPATVLTSYCYNRMFDGCSNLTLAPELPAQTLVDNCYGYMFRGCEKLRYIKCLASDISAFMSTESWVSGVSSTGMFIKNINMANWGIGISGIPDGWIINGL